MYEKAVGSLRRNNTDVDAAFGGECKSIGYAVVDYEIRRHDIYIILGVIYHLDVNITADTLVIHRAVVIRQDISLALDRAGRVLPRVE